MKTKVFGIPTPWSGDEADPTDWRYEVWFQVYRRTQAVKHWFNIHKWEYVYATDSTYCHWCGKDRTRNKE